MHIFKLSDSQYECNTRNDDHDDFNESVVTDVAGIVKVDIHTVTSIKIEVNGGLVDDEVHSVASTIAHQQIIDSF